MDLQKQQETKEQALVLELNDEALAKVIGGCSQHGGGENNWGHDRDNRHSYGHHEGGEWHQHSNCHHHR